jgi:phospholipid/cholesterol/gamma-HCH transport system permease protein
VANLVGFSLVTELGPLLTALILAGRAGAAFTAEIATMKISEEIDALSVMGIDPIRFLVWPKFAAMLIMVPLLALWADFVGIMAGGIFSATVLGLSGKVYFEQTATFLRVSDVMSGLVKSAAFGMAITLISCTQGFLAREGAADVGRRTTMAVVHSIFIMILLDLFFTALNYVLR